MSEGGHRGALGASRNTVRRALVTGEVALAVVLVTGAGLLLQTLWNLTRVDAGFDRSRLVTFELDLPAATYPAANDVVQFYGRLLERLRAIPGVEATAAMTGLPPLRNVDANDTDIEDYTRTPDGPAENVDYWQTVTTGYTETMGIPVVEGRAFEPTDAGGPAVVLVNETMARTFWMGESPLGRRLRPGFNESLPWFTVVGVVKDVKQGGVDQKTGAELYFNAEQAIDIHLEMVREFQGSPTNRDVVKHGQGVRTAMALVPEFEKQGLGAFDPAMVQRTRETVMTYMDAKDLPPADRLFTNAFAGKTKLTAAQWAQVRDSVKRYIPVKA